VWCAPPAVSSRGLEAVELAASAGLLLDEWQVFVLERALGVRDDGKWAAFEVGANIPRQNGKGGVLEARELVGLFEWGEELIIHSAHEFQTSLMAFDRLEALIDGSDELRRRVRRVVRSHGEEGITLLDGRRIRFRTRTKGGGRGFSCDTLILDEAMILPEKAVGALLPTLSARPNPQVWYTGSAVDQLVHDEGVAFARIRERGLSKTDPSLAYFEWSAAAFDRDGVELRPDQLEDALLDDVAAWRQSNPALEIRIPVEHVAKERRSMDARTFAVERLGVGDWPPTSRRAASVISPEAWLALTDEASTVLDPVVLTFDVTPDRSRAAIVASGRRADGLVHTEVVEHRRGTGWVAQRLAELARSHEVSAIRRDGRGPASALQPQLDELGVATEEVSTSDYVASCGIFFDLVANAGLRHLGTGELLSAVKGAATRPLGDAWAWSRKSSSVDISPLVAATIGVAAVVGDGGPSVYEDRGLLVV
jgi:hypothetical protein